MWSESNTWGDTQSISYKWSRQKALVCKLGSSKGYAKDDNYKSQKSDIQVCIFQTFQRLHWENEVQGRPGGNNYSRQRLDCSGKVWWREGDRFKILFWGGIKRALWAYVTRWPPSWPPIFFLKSTLEKQLYRAAGKFPSFKATVSKKHNCKR